jgi:hypothetical protein
MTHPIASAGMIARELGVTPRAAQNLVAELGLREATGRGRYGLGGLCEVRRIWACAALRHDRLFEHLL